MKIKIINGRLTHDTKYPHDFHTFFHDRTIDLYILLPGINFQSVQVKITPSQSDLLIDAPQDFSLEGIIKKEYQQIFKTNQIVIQGKLPVKVHPNSIAAQYRDGIVKIELARDLRVKSNET